MLLGAGGAARAIVAGFAKEKAKKITIANRTLENANNLPCDIKQQIITLNNIVTNFAINQVYRSAISFIKYKIDASTLAVPISTPVSTRPTTSTLELQPFF